MSSQYTPGNRNSTPESFSSLRPPVARASMAGSHQLRNSVDTGAYPSQAGRSGRPASEVIGGQGQKRDSQGETMEKATKQWIEDIDQCEAMLDEMAAAALDAEFKDELSAIEQWFKVLSEAERTAALYALLGQTTQVQIRFFVGVLQQMSKSHPTSVMLSPSGPGDRDSNRFSQVGKIGDRNSLAVNRNSQAAGNKRNSGLDYDEIKSMFPEAAAAVAQQRADFEQQTGAAPQSTRTSVVGDRSSLAAPSATAPRDEGKRDLFGPKSPVSWRRSEEPQAAASRPKSSSGQQPMGQFGQQPQQQQQQQAPTSSFRRPMPLSNEGLQHQSMGHFEAPLSSMFSPMNGGWASAMATPMVPGFGSMMQGPNINDVAAATQSKLNAMSTINNRMNLDNTSSNYRRARSTEGDRGGMPPPAQHPGMGGALRDQTGQILSPEQAAMMQAQMLGMGGQRSPTHSPARGPPTAGLPGVPHQNNGFLSVFGSGPGNMNQGMAGLNLGGYGHDTGYLSDASEINRGRSPRGRRGTSKPPEDPTNPNLLDDVPAWLRSLRLHKYTDNLKDMKWTEIVQLDDEGLEKRGITAKGARTKMLKVFEQVREAQGVGKH